MASGSELGKKIDSFISAGNLVPLEVVVSTIITAIKNAPKDFVLIDGYPRSEEQMGALDGELAKCGGEIELGGVFEVDVSEEVARARVLGRARGADDNEAVFVNRMKVYLEPIKAIREFYAAKGLLVTINGERGIEEIVSDLKARLEERL